MGGPESELRFTSHHVFGYTGYIPTRGVFGRATDRTVRKGDYVRIDNFARSTDSDIHGANCVAMSDQKGKHDRPPDELLVYTHSGTRDRFKRVGKIIDGYKKQNKKDGLEGKVVASTVWERFKPAAVKATIDEAAKKEEKSRADRAARVRAGTKKK